MIHEFRRPLPVVVDGTGMWENDTWCVVLCDGGIVRHYTTSQIRVHLNATFGIRRE